MAEAVFERGVGWFAGSLQDAPVDAHQPAVVAAPQPMLADQPELQGGSTMGTVQLHQACVPAAIAEDHQVLAQDTDALG